MTSTGTTFFLGLTYKRWLRLKNESKTEPRAANGDERQRSNVVLSEPSSRGSPLVCSMRLELSLTQPSAAVQSISEQTGRHGWMDSQSVRKWRKMI